MTSSEIIKSKIVNIEQASDEICSSVIYTVKGKVHPSLIVINFTLIVCRPAWRNLSVSEKYLSIRYNNMLRDARSVKCGYPEGRS